MKFKEEASNAKETYFRYVSCGAELLTKKFAKIYVSSVSSL